MNYVDAFWRFYFRCNKTITYKQNARLHLDKMKPVLQRELNPLSFTGYVENLQEDL